SVWVVDEPDKDGEPLVRMLPMPGQVTMMRFSPDGKYLAVYLPHVVEMRTETRVREVTTMVDGKPVTKIQNYSVATKHAVSMLKVFDTATGKVVLTHVGASGVMAFCADSGRLASAAGSPVFRDRHGHGPVVMPAAPTMPKGEPLPPPKA